MRRQHAFYIVSTACISVAVSANGPADDAAKQEQALRALVASGRVAIFDGRFADYSGPLADLAYRIGNKSALTDVFETCARSCTAADKYVAFTEYARALSKFSDPAAEKYFQSAIQLHARPGDATRAYGAYVDYLCDSGRCEDARTLINGIDRQTATQDPRFLMMALQVTRRLGETSRKIEEQARFAGIETFSYAEGFTSAAPDEPMELGYRMFTIYSRPCDGMGIPVRLVADPETVTLKPGQRFRLGDVVLRAYDESGAFLSRQPVGATLVFPRSVLGFESDNDRRFAVTARTSGSASGFFSASCARGVLQAKVTFIVE